MYVDESVFTDHEPFDQAAHLISEIFGLPWLSNQAACTSGPEPTHLVREIIGLPASPTWEQVCANLAEGEWLGVLLPFSGIALIVEDKAYDWEGTVAPHADPQARYFALTSQLVAQVKRVVASRD